MPVKIAPTGGYASKPSIRLYIQANLFTTYLANASTNGCRKRIEDIYDRIQPRQEFVTATLKLTRTKCLFSKYGEDSVGRIAGLEAAQ